MLDTVAIFPIRKTRTEYMGDSDLVTGQLFIYVIEVDAVIILPYR